MNLIFRSLPQIPSGKMPFEKLKKAKKSQIRDDALVLFPGFRLFWGRVLGLYLRKRHERHKI